MQPETNSNEPAVKVRLEPAVTFSRRETGGHTSYVAHHPAMGKFFRFGPEERHIAELLDGTRGIGEVVTQLADDGINWDPRDVAEFVSKLVSGRLASVVDDGSDKCESDTQGDSESSPKPQPNGWKHRFPKWLSLLISQRIPLLSADSIAKKLNRKIGWCFDAKGMMAWSALVTSGLLIVYGHVDAFAAELRRMFDPGLWLILIAMWCVTKIIHESGHAVAARHRGVRVGKLGVMFFFMAPLAYVDVTDAWKLKSRWHRIQIALAGVYLELAIAAVAAWAWWVLPDGMMKHLAAQFFLIAGPASLLVNANPLLRLDGYYVLSDLTEIPNLRMHGRQQLGASLEYRLLRIPKPRALLNGWRKGFASCHAAMSVVFQFFWMSGLVLAVSIWAKGLGMVLGLAAVTLWAALPLARWVYRVWNLDPGEGYLRMNPKRKRLVGYGLLVLMMCQYLSTASSPLDRRVPVIVRFRNEQIARATSDAFVRNVYVVRGQRVKMGTLLMELEDVELQIRRDEKGDDLRITELKAIQFRRQGQLAQAAAEIENAESIRRQVAELDQQLDGLHIMARRDGLVIAARLESMQGSFVSKGTELLRVSDPNEKELLASVSERDMQAYKDAAALRQPARVRLRGGTILSAVPASLRPRARRTLPHPALAATVGGPLAVEPSPEEGESMRMAQPYLESVTKLDPVTSAEVRAGQVGTMTVSDDRSLLARLLDKTTDPAQQR